jgi:hypothetical protein
VKRLMVPFGDALRMLQSEIGPFEVIPARSDKRRPLIEEG